MEQIPNDIKEENALVGEVEEVFRLGKYGEGVHRPIKIISFRPEPIDTNTIILTIQSLKELAMGIFPKVWKHAVVVPLFKCGDINSVNNYRPISLMPIISKIFEKITDKIYNNMDNNRISLLTLCNLSKAFDSVSHSILLSKFANLNIDSFWFKDCQQQNSIWLPK